LAIVEFSRFWAAPRLPRRLETLLMAASMAEMAAEVSPLAPMSSEFRVRVVARAALSVTERLSTPDEVPMPMWKLTDVELPLSSLTPLNSVDRPMRSISSTRLRNSSLSVVLSWPETVPLAACTDSSRRRVRIELTSLSAPSVVCTMEMPSLALRLACSSERTCERRRSEIARPAASSAAVAMRRPVASRRKLPSRRPVLVARFRCALMDATLVLTLRPMNPLSPSELDSACQPDPPS